MKFYGHPYSNNTMRAQLCLDEKGFEYEYVLVDLFQGAHKKPDFLAINPRGQVPALVDGDVTTYESIAIAQYLELKRPGLMPTAPVAAARCFRLIAEFNQKLDPVAIFGSVRFRGMRRAELGDRVPKFLNECQIWEGYLGEDPYFVGDAYSLADIVVLPFFAVAIDGLGLPQSEFPRLHAWYRRCQARPSVAKQPWFDAFAADRENADQHVLASSE